VIIDAKRNAIHPWKTSSPATLSHGLDEESRRLLAGADAVGEIEASAASLSVRLVRTRDGWRLLKGDAFQEDTADALDAEHASIHV